MDLSHSWPELLERYWGPEFELRSHQQPIVENLCAGQDVLALLPTGEGKSLCFQLAGLSIGGLTLVISPLLALIQEQVSQLRSKKITAWQLSSQLSPEERRQLMREIKQGAQAFLYLAPEQLQSEALQSLLREMPPRFLVIDEAHCISQWGHSFRPAYRSIGKLLLAWEPRPVMGVFTATAPPHVQADICQVLGLSQPQTYQGAVLRENIAVSILRCWTPRGKRQALLKNLNAKSLIYARSRQACEDLAAMLQKAGYSAGFYHAGSSLSRRQEAYLRFREPNDAILVATTAFGMGVDIPDIATVIHWHLPESLDAYVQEVGRAGRNRTFLAKAVALSLWGEKSKDSLLIEPELPKRVWKLLAQGFSLLEIQDRLDLDGNTLLPILTPWLEKGFIQPQTGQSYQVSANDVSKEQVQLIFAAQKQIQATLKFQKKAFQGYLNSRRCRRQSLENYFATPIQAPCGQCDRCC
jgi:ATP-dependent DNA helicase RecQ